jgi:hypothetical protein
MLPQLMQSDCSDLIPNAMCVMQWRARNDTKPKEKKREEEEGCLRAWN